LVPFGTKEVGPSTEEKIYSPATDCPANYSRTYFDVFTAILECAKDVQHMVMATEQVEVIVKLAPAGVERGTAEHRAVQECATRLGISLELLHPGTSDPNLATFAVAHVRPDDAQTVVRQLMQCDGVEGAYAKPPGEPP
jgi:hypothetical protein